MRSGRVQPTPCVVLCRALSRTSSLGSSRDSPSAHRAVQEETAPPRIAAIHRSLSGKLSSSQLSADSRKSLRSTSSSSSSSEDDPQPRRRSGGLCGIRNVGNSCYQNSVFQFLNAIPEMAHFLLETKGLATSGKIAFDMKRLFNEMSRARDYSVVVDTFALRRKLGVLDRKWAGYSQEDAHEFLTQLISALQEDCNRNAAKPKYRELEERPDARIQAVEEWKYSKQWNDSGIDDVFGFQLHSQTTCPQCHYQSHRFGYQTSLELPLPRESTDLLKCLVDFTSNETLNKENAWQCPKCREPVQAVQQLSLSRLPKVLIICLKRFGTSTGRFFSFQSWKNNVSVRLPSNNKINLKEVLSRTLDSMTEKGTEYELAAIVDHSGSVNYGHYTARVKDVASGNWYLMNDDIVRKINSPTGPSESAYILALRQVETS